LLEDRRILEAARPGFALELAEDTLICFRVQRVRGFKVARVEQMQMFLHVLVQIIGLDVTTKRVRVGKQQFTFVTILGFQILVIKFVHDYAPS